LADLQKQRKRKVKEIEVEDGGRGYLRDIGEIKRSFRRPKMNSNGGKRRR
jgi:hypothetical protein